MKIAVLSGKGGTGKTLVSVNLAAVSDEAVYVDCDVEEPNGHLFFKPEHIQTEKISAKIPYVDQTRCNGCGDCVTFCQFNALAYVNNKWMLFEKICHSCGGCTLICPQKALAEKDKIIGEVQIGISNAVKVVSGFLNTGEVSGIPIIKRELIEIEDDKKITFIDCPPGSACIVMESIKTADYCVLVAEPTIFGRHNLNMVYELVRLFKKPFGVVLNKYMEGDNPSEAFCIEKNIKVLGNIPFDSELGMINSNALIVVNEDSKYRDVFSNILANIIKEVEHEKIINP